VIPEPGFQAENLLHFGLRANPDPPGDVDGPLRRSQKLAELLDNPFHDVKGNTVDPLCQADLAPFFFGLGSMCC